ncbi:MAG: universal stress protein [Acidimicrobiia bacterium]|jgi:nucleotide-binding universal stress UspA family protein
MAIVVGFIDNPEGRQALDLAIEEAGRRQARLIVVHSMRGGSRTKEDEYLRYQQALQRLEAEMEERGIEHEIKEYVRDQTPAEDLMEAVEEFDAELLVIGYKRRTATGKLLLGSHAQDVLMSATVPVLAVMAPE